MRTDAKHRIGTTVYIVPIGAAAFRAAPICTNRRSHNDDGVKTSDLARLLAAAMRACDRWGDSPAARDEMRRQVAEVPPEHRAGLLAHFERTYPEGATHD